MNSIGVRISFSRLHDDSLLKPILEKTILKDKYNTFLAYEGCIQLITEESIYVDNFDKNYFLELIKNIIKETNLTKIEAEISYSENNINKKQLILYYNNKLFFGDGLYSYGHFCPHCLQDADLEQILNEYDCPYCRDKITKCIQIFHKSNIYICDAYHELLDVDELIDEEIRYNPDKIITCPECGANYKLKNIQKGAKNSLKQITL